MTETGKGRRGGPCRGEAGGADGGRWGGGSGMGSTQVRGKGGKDKDEDKEVGEGTLVEAMSRGSCACHPTMKRHKATVQGKGGHP